MVAFHLSEQVFMIIKNETIHRDNSILKLDVLSISFSVKLGILPRDKDL